VKLILSIIALAVLFTGCGYKEGVVSTSAKAYIYFSGDVTSAVVSIDEGADFSVQSGKNNQYAIKPGKHIIKVYKNGELKVKREIYVGDGISKEIEVK